MTTTGMDSTEGTMRLKLRSLEMTAGTNADQGRPPHADTGAPSDWESGGNQSNV